MPANDDNDNAKSATGLAAGMLVSHYCIIEKIGAGGMGKVCLAENFELDRKVILSSLPDLCRDADYRTRFKREAQAAAKISDPNIVTMHEIADYHDPLYIVMENLGGKSLKEIIPGCYCHVVGEEVTRFE